jgi:uncharacterized protein (DUF3820 family)
MANEIIPNKKHLFKLAKATMPFGKYKGRLLIDLPEHYLIWFKTKGFPDNNLGKMMQEIYEIKLNGLEHILKNL